MFGTDKGAVHPKNEQLFEQQVAGNCCKMLIIIRIIIIINTVAAELNVLIFKYYFVETSTLPT